jgi:glutathione-regulated potassium-efflux system ancillary protein KefG
MVPAVPDSPDLTFHDLYEAYPRLDVDVTREQELLLTHDIVVFQFPFYWYSTPPMLKQWQDLVLEHGWAYGSQGHALEGKTFICALSTGGRADAYRPEGYNRFTVRQLLAPIEQTARLCGMRYVPPFIVHGTHRLSSDEIAQAGRDYRALLEGLLEGRLEGAGEEALDDADVNPLVQAWSREMMS